MSIWRRHLLDDGKYFHCQRCKCANKIDRVQKVYIVCPSADDVRSYYPGYVCKVCGNMVVDVEDFHEA
ncbi:hypothetical protein KAR91_26590 [Candidatus Pacearchaeota archaeon]|nr:hypothetical protein [Candidatus Pacearchaeota archaeon]